MFVLYNALMAELAYVAAQINTANARLDTLEIFAKLVTNIHSIKQQQKLFF